MSIPLSLPLHQWPAIDQAAWADACRGGDFLDPDGGAVRWSEFTLREVRKRYGQWLRFLESQDNTDFSARPGERLTRGSINAFVVSLRNRGLAPATIKTTVTALREAVRVMDANAELSVVAEVLRRLRRHAAPTRNKGSRIVPISRLISVTLDHIEKLPELSCPTDRVRHSWYRDALLVLFLAWRPIRLRNLAMIRINRHLRKDGARYWCGFSAAETKEKRALDFHCPEELTPHIDKYLSLHRPALLIDGVQSDSFWVSTRGGPARPNAIYGAVCKLTEQLVGSPVNPHLFRDCLISEMADWDPAHLLAYSRILGHSTLETTTRHYHQAKMAGAVRALQNAVEHSKKQGRHS